MKAKYGKENTYPMHVHYLFRCLDITFLLALVPPPHHGELTHPSLVHDYGERWWMTVEEEFMITPLTYSPQTMMARVQASHHVRTLIRSHS